MQRIKRKHVRWSLTCLNLLFVMSSLDLLEFGNIITSPFLIQGFDKDFNLEIKLVLTLCAIHNWGPHPVLEDFIQFASEATITCKTLSLNNATCSMVLNGYFEVLWVIGSRVNRPQCDLKALLLLCVNRQCAVFLTAWEHSKQYFLSLPGFAHC